MTDYHNGPGFEDSDYQSQADYYNQEQEEKISESAFDRGYKKGIEEAAAIAEMRSRELNKKISEIRKYFEMHIKKYLICRREESEQIAAEIKKLNHRPGTAQSDAIAIAETLKKGEGNAI